MKLSLYSETRGTAAAIEKDKRQQEIIRVARVKGKSELALPAAD